MSLIQEKEDTAGEGANNENNVFGLIDTVDSTQESIGVLPIDLIPSISDGYEEVASLSDMEILVLLEKSHEDHVATELSIELEKEDAGEVSGIDILSTKELDLLEVGKIDVNTVTDVIFCFVSFDYIYFFI